MANLRKTVRRRSRPPKFQVNWQALLVPPVVLAALIAFFVSGKTIFDRPVSQLIIEGPFQRVTAIQVEAALAPELGPDFCRSTSIGCGSGPSRSIGSTA